MIRPLLTASLCVACAAPALAQSHPIPHPRPHPHDSLAHPRPDSAHHAALHALLHGAWTGTLTSPHGSSEAFHLSVAHDSLRHEALKVMADHALRAGAASRFAMSGDTLRWTQELNGKSCTATATVTPATPSDSGVLRGTVACADGTRSFLLRKTSR